MTLKNILVCSVLMASCTLPLHADEGQWQPHQLLELKTELKRIGIQIPVEKIADLSKHPMTAIVSLGGCSAAFVSPNGLIVTNHHCAYSAIQRNASAEKNYIEHGFLAKNLQQELPAGPNQRIYVTDQVTDVTAQVLQGIDPASKGKARHEGIERNIKQLIAACESTPDYRCAVPSFHRGLEFYLVRQLMLRDIRLVYAPAEAIGAFGGDIDNYEFPRHTGDFAFLRAYVNKEGKPADPSPDNVPYQSKDYLVVSAEGLRDGDPILLAGYPGRTSRYKLPDEIRYARDTDYPIRVTDYQRDLNTIAEATSNNPEWVVRYANTVKSVNNRMKKLQGLLDGFARKDLVAIKQQQHHEFLAWVDQQGNAERYRHILTELDELIKKDQALNEQEFVLSQITSSELLSAAAKAYRLAKEKEKPNAERDTGYQQRDLPFTKASLQRLEQSLVPEVDRRRWVSALSRYQQFSGEKHLPAVNKAMLLPRKDLNRWTEELYKQSKMADTDFRLRLLEQPVEAFTASSDHLVRLAVMLHDVQHQTREARKALDGDFDYLIPQYMQAVIAWKKSLGKPVYPDANGTLRVTYGTVSAYSPRDGLYKGPFTTVDGIVEKHTGKSPFDAPEQQVKAIAGKRFGVFRDPVLKTVPVNFLSSADTTGGNSGSAVMNRRGELIGLNFDSTYESITKDWYFDPEITRAIHVDIRYMLWVMKELDGAENLLVEMKIKYPK